MTNDDRVTVTLSELRRLARTAEWFRNVGHFPARSGFRAIHSLDAWRSEDADASGAEVADAMTWLPTASGEDDPFYGSELRELMKQVSQPALKAAPAELFQAVLASLDRMKAQPALNVGPHDFTEAARGAALFAFRAAAMESVTGRGSRWTELAVLYADGFWPCGLLPDAEIVVF